MVRFGFISHSGPSPILACVISSDGAAYYFPNRESSFWSESFGGLFDSRVNSAHTRIRASETPPIARAVCQFDRQPRGFQANPIASTDGIG